ncbi:acetyl-CoA carboxylase carboxyltransferase subunit beta [Miltoncostaea oceani]|uniref:acetyl-CoA carboxylase carboxyltransferase subunit beta n=1 Tax=Miltoncostaea oceani TaxID=2843216 RepID=UPI001C3DE1C9|nr:acetyl-CoA carboxylase carboxyltransferase subunit beta [Miltoncostaea oceani]
MSKRPITVSVDRLRRKRPDGPPPRRLPADERSCPKCQSHWRADEMRRNLRVCATCGHHFAVGARERLDQFADDGWLELWPELRASDPLQFVDLEPYPDRVERAERAGNNEALVVGELAMGGHECIAAIMDFSYLGGSMGSVVGEKLARAADRCVERGVPMVVLTASGGARMQEGVIALMQMAKTVVAFELMQDAELPVIVVLVHPTTGGVWASFASLGDVTYAEPGALIAFSGPRVIEQTTREKLAPEFGRAETQLLNGQVDAVVDRRELKDRIAKVLGILERPTGLDPAPAVTWAQETAERAASVARGLPERSRRLVSKVLKPEEGA